jgi:hypothetical protein
MKTIALDFDGVLAQYTGWKGQDVLGEPLPGAIEWLQTLLEEFEVVIHSTRSPIGLVSWFDLHAPGLLAKCDHISISAAKPPAWVTIDDRCICFKGTYPSTQEINAFVPWWKK